VVNKDLYRARNYLIYLLLTFLILSSILLYSTLSYADFEINRGITFLEQDSLEPVSWFDFNKMKANPDTVCSKLWQLAKKAKVNF